MADLLTELRAHLINQGVVRNPKNAGPLPPMWLNPRYGPIYPGQKPDKATATEVGPDEVVSAFRVAGVPSIRHEGFMRVMGVDLHITVRRAFDATQMEEALYRELHDRRGWQMAGIFIQESLQFRDLQLVASDDNGFHYTTEFLFWVFDSAL